MVKSFPAWLIAHRSEPGIAKVDIDRAYPVMLNELKALPTTGFDGTVTQYWLEVARCWIRLEVLFWFQLAGLATGKPGYVLRILLVSDPGTKGRWAQKHFPKGRMETLEREYGIENARKIVAVEARNCYRVMRGFVPQ